MNVLFMTLLGFDSIYERSIYTDLLREFIKNGHEIYVISPIERRNKVGTHLIKESHATILRLRIGNTQKTNIIEKGISTILIEPTFKIAIRKYFSDVKFDLILYSTPPVTLTSAVEYVKKRDSAKTYLLLKDIFPQNAVDLGMMRTKGLRGLLFRHFRKQEEKLYQLSDRIGCMSKANVNYVLKHNPSICAEKVEVCPNCIEVIDKSVDDETRISIREEYDIPIDKTVFVYGGNLGKPQSVPFLIKCLKCCRDISNAFFLIVGDGTEYEQLEAYIISSHQDNVKLLKRLQKDEFDSLVAACDVGMIILDYRFTIPNFPSRLLSYMQAKVPVLAATDINTDIGKVITGAGFGWWIESKDEELFSKLITDICNCETREIEEMKLKEWAYLQDNFSVESVFNMNFDTKL